MSLELRIQTTSAEIAESVLKPLENKQETLTSEDAEGAVDLAAGDIRRRMGAAETIILLPVILKVAAFSANVAAGVVAAWIWSKVSSGKDRPGRLVELTLVISTDGAERSIELDLSSEEAARNSIEKALKDNDSGAVNK